MKRVITCIFLTFPMFVQGQGTVTFNNRATAGSPVPVVAPVFNADWGCLTCEKRGNPTATWNGSSGPTPAPIGTQTYSGAPLTGTGFTAAIWGVNVNVPDSELLRFDAPPLAAVPFRVAGTQLSLLGFWEGRTVAVPGVVGASSDRAKFIIRAWDNRGGTITSWEQALNSLTPWGDSGVFTVNAALGLAPAVPPPNLEGFQSFQLIPVPEPSVIALGVLGAGCLFLLRRRK
jgi:hypothetical protein